MKPLRSLCWKGKHTVNVKKRLELLEKKFELDSFSVVPMQERVMMFFGHTQDELDGKKSERLAELHRKYGHFDESVLTIIHIRFVGTPPRADVEKRNDLTINNQLSSCKK